MSEAIPRATVVTSIQDGFARSRMRCPIWIRAQDLDRWAATSQAKTTLPELLRRLVFATVPREHLQKVDFPAGAEVQRPGYDGTTASTQCTAFVPEGICFWELGCVVGNPKGKAQGDYDKRIDEHRARLSAGETDDIKETSFIAVTPLDWQKADEWARERTKDGHFKTVHAYDSNQLEHWLQDAPAVGLWLAQQIHGKRDGVTDVGEHWKNVQGTLRYSLQPKVLLVNRDGIAAAFSDWLNTPSGELAVKAPSAAELVAVFCAWVQTLPSDAQDAIASRAIIVDSRETWRALATSQQPLILISSAHLEPDPDLFSEAVRQGHHVLRFADFRTSRGAGSVELAMMRRFDLQQALAQSSVPELEARQLAEAAGGNFTILRRRLARSPNQSPAWAQDNGLAALLLAAAWEDERPADQNSVSVLGGKPYPEIQSLLKKVRLTSDAPVRLVNRTWEFLSPVDAWEALHPLLNTAQMDNFQRLAVEVLSEDNPALELLPAERFMASVKGKVWKFSGALRRGIAEILALAATREADSAIGMELRCAERADFIVAKVLPENASWKRWASLGDLLPLLVEASPKIFLQAVERDLKSSDPQLVELLRQEVSGGITGAAYHSGLLWALETAAWSTEHFQRVARSLTRLAELDPGGQWANRPLASGGHLFFSKRPQTVASVGERVETLRYLCQKEPAGAWKLLVTLLPQSHGFFMDNSKPSYRSWAAGWTGRVSRKSHDSFLSELTNLLIEAAGNDGERWTELLGHITHLPAPDLDKVIAKLEVAGGQISQGEPRTKVWKKLRELVLDHAHFSDAWWALSPAVLDKFSKIRDQLAPDDLVVTSACLFDDSGVRFGDKSLSYEQREQQRQNEQRAAVKSIWGKGGLQDIVELTRKVKQPWTVGVALAKEFGAEARALIVPSLLVVEDSPIQQFARAFAGQLICSNAAEWAEEQPDQNWNSKQIAAWALHMPFAPRTWDWLQAKGTAAEQLYWKETGAWGQGDLDVNATERAIKNLQAVGRNWSALGHLMMALHVSRPIPPSLVCDALEQINVNGGERTPHTMDAHHVQEAFKFLQERNDADEAHVARLEFAFLPFLDGHTRLPLTLQRELARNPDFFVECLKILFRAKHEQEESKPSGTVDPGEKARAERIWQLFNDWQTIPGTLKDGTISLEALRDWVRVARDKARACDRLEVADVTIGELFACSPEDTDQAKPVIAIREVIEECESEKLETGFHIGLCNLRGCYSKDLYEGGKQERELAERFERCATISSKWPRTAEVLRGVAKSYLSDAAREDERARARD